jgi:hypothetical protein
MLHRGIWGWRRDRGGRGGASNITFISHCCSESAGCCQVEASPETDQVIPGVGAPHCSVLYSRHTGGFYALIFPPSIPDRELVTSLLTKTISVCLQRGNPLALAGGSHFDLGMGIGLDQRGVPQSFRKFPKVSESFRMVQNGWKWFRQVSLVIHSNVRSSGDIARFLAFPGLIARKIRKST